MSSKVDTDTLRVAATDWSLDGDRKLLDLLQNIHQKITTKCQEASGRLDEMVTSLDNASVSLQNVNNRFMALSNTKFVESRVYDDDTDVATESAHVKKTQDNPKNLEDSLLNSLLVLEAMHEPLTIMDESESDSDDDIGEKESVILKPKDLYAERPLPYIIGSQSWKNKWHAGLILEDSDSDSTASRHTDRVSEDLSESDSDVIDEQMDRQPEPVYSMSDTIQQKREDIEESLYKPPMTKIHKPYTTTAPLFPDEPPPLDKQDPDDDKDIPSSESEEDIFAELLKGDRKRKVEELRSEQAQNPIPVTQKSSLFQEEDSSGLFAEITKSAVANEEQGKTIEDKTVSSVKKPVGAISLFGSNRGAESIGAAILKRQQRKSSSDESEDIEHSRVSDHLRPQQRVLPNTQEVNKPIENVTPSVNVKEKEVKPKESNIFDELFAQTEKKTKVETKKVDIFSDIFDDIDDIFTNVKEESKVKKSIFDDELFKDVKIDKQDDKDDLFEEPPPLPETKIKTENNVTKSENLKSKPKSIFDDDDDDLFIANNNKIPQITENPIMADQTKNSQNVVKTKSIFDSDSDDGDIFAKLKPAKSNFQDENQISTNRNNNATERNDTSNIEKDIADTKKYTGSILSTDTVNIVPNISKTDNKENITHKDTDFKKDTDFVSTDVTNSRDLIQEISVGNKPANNSKNKSKSSEDEWETDVPSNGEDDEKTDIQECKKPKILEKPMLAQISKTIVENQEVLDEESLPIAKDLHTTNVQKKTNNLKEESNKKKDKEKSSPISDIFSEVPPALEVVKPKVFSVQSSSIQSENTLSKSMNNIFENEGIQHTEQEEYILPTDDNFDEIFDQPPSLIKNDVGKAELFSDIPPPLEVRAKETKNTNINALFGDDSDDESLFFKTEPPIEDEPPKSDLLESIFHDEPPELDIDFISEASPSKLEKIDLLHGIDEDKNTENSKNDNLVPNLDKAVDETDQSEAIKHDDKKVKNNMLEHSDTTDTTKPIGKLKPMNFNINVNTLLPGASPKKTVTKPDNVTASPIKTMTDKRMRSNVTEAKMPGLVKSVSFDSDPDSLILDNKISKERAKIQVKRRPSSRRARQEAVRKSGIDFVDAKDTESLEDLEQHSNKDSYEHAKDLSKKIDLDNYEEQHLKEPSSEYDEQNDNKISNKEDPSRKHDEQNDKISNKGDESDKKGSEIKENAAESTQVLSINSEDIYIFKEPAKIDAELTNTDTKSNVETIQAKKDDEPPKNVISIFDDDEEDDIFGEKSNNFKTSHKIKKDYTESDVKVTQSDVRDVKSTEKVFLDDDLRTPAKSGRRLVITDYDDDDNLFGTNINATKESKNKSKPLTSTTKITEENNDIFKTISKSVKNNPKSVLDDDDDDDLFSFTKTARNTASSNKNDGVQTLGKAYREKEDLIKTKTTKSEEKAGNTKQGSIDKKPKPISLFDDSSDEELFGGKKSKTKKSEKVFSNDSEEELFSKKSSKKKDVTTPKAKLFDDGDDDDLFATKKGTKSQPKAETSLTQEKQLKSQEIVFNDPLSMFDDD